jgi:hypothetical protein
MKDSNSEKLNLLAEYHHTISEQLNSRLSESPKFFALLVVVASGYGYVLANPKADAQLCPSKPVFALATWLSLAVIAWASWYLAALGYAFRFLQNIQVSIERALEWNSYAPASGKPPDHPWWKPWEWLWLLPGIYHPHAIGLALAFGGVCWIGLSGAVRYRTLIVGIIGIFGCHLYYLMKIKAKTKGTPVGRGRSKS